MYLIARLALMLFGLGAFLLPFQGARAQDLAPIPPLTAHAIDSTGTLDAAQLQALETRLRAFEKERGTQIVVLIVPTVQPEDIADYTQRVGDAWKIGRKGIGDGLLLIVAKSDRKVRIAPAKALEGAIPDLAAKQIIDEAITPRFRQGDFAGGIDAAVNQLMARISGENLALPDAGADLPAKNGFQWTDMAVFLFFAVPIGVRVLSSVLGRKLGVLSTAGAVGVLAWIFTASALLTAAAVVLGALFALFMSLMKFTPGLGSGSSGWGSGGGFSSGGDSGGGGFSSGGGGDFGGGGASGDW